jgi:hypothetical protein
MVPASCQGRGRMVSMHAWQLRMGCGGRHRPAHGLRMAARCGRGWGCLGRTRACSSASTPARRGCCDTSLNTTLPAHACAHVHQHVQRIFLCACVLPSLTLPTIFSHWVPLPAAGAPEIITRRGRAPLASACTHGHERLSHLSGLRFGVSACAESCGAGHNACHCRRLAAHLDQDAARPRRPSRLAP